MKKKRIVVRGLAYSNERYLLLLLLAVASGTFVFSFFLSSRDVKSAQNISSLAQGVDGILDKIVQDLSNSGQIDHPFEGISKQCLFHRAINTGSMDPSLETEGFMFSEEGLFHLVKNASGANILKPYQDFANPLISGIQLGQFERMNSRLIKLVCQVKVPSAPDIVQRFERNIFLKNQ